MIGTHDLGITIAVPEFGAEYAICGSNKMHIGGEVWAAITGGRSASTIIPEGDLAMQQDDDSEEDSDSMEDNSEVSKLAVYVAGAGAVYM
jgi:hypothetical protein